MNHWIDDLARAAAGGLSRREALQRISGAVAGGLLAALLPRPTQAQSDLASCREFCQGTAGEALNQCLRACQACGGATQTTYLLCQSRDRSTTACCAQEQFTCNEFGQCIPPSPGGVSTCPSGTTFCSTAGCCPRGTVCQNDSCVPGQ